jgi:hypothetical protein
MLKYKIGVRMRLPAWRAIFHMYVLVIRTRHASKSMVEQSHNVLVPRKKQTMEAGHTSHRHLSHSLTHETACRRASNVATGLFERSRSSPAGEREVASDHSTRCQ